MSDFTLAATALQPYDPWGPLQKLATIGQTNAATQGQQITNQGSQLSLGLRQAQLASLAQQNPGSPLASLAGSAPGGVAPQGGLAQLAGGGALGLTGSPAAPNATPANSNSLAALALPQAGSPALPPTLGVTMAGMTMPQGWAYTAMGSNDQAKVFADAAAERVRRLHELATSATTPQQWDANVTAAFSEGWLNPQQYRQYLGQFPARAAVQQSLGDANAQLSYNSALSAQGLQSDANGNPVPSAAAATAKGNIAGAEATGRNQSDLTFKPLIDQAENGPLADRAGQTARATLGTDVTKAQRAPYNLAPGETRVNPPVPGQPQGRSADLLGGGPMSPTDYANTVNGTENGTGNPAAKNPLSSATGNGQFINSTWLNTMRAARPDLAGLTDQQLLTLRSSPGMAQQGTIALAQQNAPLLQQAGFTPNSATLGMAHRLGAGGAIAVLNAPSSTLLSSILPANVIAANPDLANQTAGGFVNGAKAKYGLQPVALAGGASPSTQRVAAPASGAPGAAPAQMPSPQPSPINGQVASPNLPVPGGQPQPSPWNAPPAQPAPVITQLPGGGSAVQSGITPAGVEQQKNDVLQMADYRKGLLTNAQAATDQNAHITQMTDQSGNFTMGWGADQKLQAKAVFDGIAKTFGIPESQSFSDSLGSQQAFLKNAGELARAAARQVGSRTGAQELGMIQSNLPSDTMSSQAFGRVMTQMGGLNDYAIAKSAAAANASGNPSQFEAAWNAHVSPTPFIINRMSPQDAQTLATNLGKTAQGRAAWANIMTEMKFADQNGLFGLVH